MEIIINYQMVAKVFDQFIEIVKDVTDEINKMKEKRLDLDLFWDSEANAEYNMRLLADFFEAEVLLKQIKENIVILAKVIEKGQEKEKVFTQIISEM